jgi:hypothetical protein
MILIQPHMKALSIIFIILYLLLPVACMAHPCSLHDERVHQEAADTIDANQSEECPGGHDTDSCETTCCCAGHLPLSSTTIPFSGLMAKHLPHDPNIALPRLIDRIFVPPQNLA